MTFYYRLGSLPQKRHTQFRKDDGNLYHEEVMGINGFAGIQSILYHLEPPTRLIAVESLPLPALNFEEQGAVRHRHFRAAAIATTGNAVDGRVPLMGNTDVTLYLVKPVEAMQYWYKHSSGDEILFVHEGTGTLETQFGVITYRPGDYLVIPTGVLWRVIPDQNTDQKMLVIEANGHITPPKRYLNNYGQFLENSPYCERDIRPPEQLITRDESGSFEIRIKSRGVLTRATYERHPLSVIGWDGHLWPFAFNIEDFEPITGRVHQPPPVHQTFDGPGFVVCSFVPRMFDYHPQAIPAPYNHSNVDSDEVLYYVAGDFMSRKDIEVSSITVHPNGIPHGPHPGTYEGSIGKKRTEELAVMVDTFRPLRMCKPVLEVEDSGYPFSWLPGKH